MNLIGEYGKAFVSIDEVEPSCLTQIYSFLNHPAFTNPIAIMPDTHAGNGAVIGFTMPMTEKVIPNVIGVDIGCGMLAHQYSITSDELKISFEEIDKQIRKEVPLGFNIRKGFRCLHGSICDNALKELIVFTNKYNAMFDTEFECVNYRDPCYFNNLCNKIGASSEQVYNSTGTLGGGNHYIEIGKGKDNRLWSIVHTGSRNFGLKIANYHQKMAGNTDLSYLQGSAAYDYIVDMIFAQQYAAHNRRLIQEIIGRIIGEREFYPVESVHNYIDPDDMIIRKGAIRSYRGEDMVIPFNMRDGTLICTGKSNREWNYSAPHGAGRLMSRNQAKKNISVDKFREQMTGIFSTCVGQRTLDEAPDAYKDAGVIEKAISPTATIVDRIKPMYNLKG